MNDANFLIVRRVVNVTRDGLGPYVLDAYKMRYSKKEYLKVLQETLRLQYPFASHADALEVLDLQAWLNAMEFKWEEVFHQKIGRHAPQSGKSNVVRAARSYVNELRDFRNLLAHEAPTNEFTDDDVYRIADTASRPLRAAKRKEAEKTKEIQHDFAAKIFGVEDKSNDAVNLNESDPLAEQVQEHLANKPNGIIILKQAAIFLLCAIAVVAAIIFALVLPPHTPLVNLKGSNLRGMDLTGRNLRFADLTEVDMVESILRMEDLSGVNLERAELHKADLSTSTLTDANLIDADLREAILTNAVLKRANLSESNLRKANMEYADFTNAHMSNSDADTANLRNSVLENAALDGANLVGADFRGANLRGANMEGAVLKLPGRDLLRRDPSEAVFDETTILPDGSYWDEDTDMTKFTG